MAEKKTAEKPAEKTAPAAAAKVPVFIPKEGKGDDERFIAVNGRRLLVKTGMTVFLPPEFAEVIANSQAQAVAADAYIESVTSE